MVDVPTYILRTEDSVQYCYSFWFRTSLAEVTISIVSWCKLSFCDFSTHMEQFLPNEDLIRQLCTQYDVNVGQVDHSSEPTSPTGKSSPTKNNASVGQVNHSLESTSYR